ncbi:MAG: guanylate kinase [Gammaproteobacteria bacterium]|nr:guanylate kinase [Gammaproteobacteria bacterium]
MQQQGTIYVIAAASGTGKTSLVEVLVESLDSIITSISFTTRPRRPGEQDCEHYCFVNDEKFQQMIVDDDFLEYADVFGHYYGTSKSWVAKQLHNGNDVILEIDWQGAKQVKELFPNCISIFILPPSMQELRRRLEKRQQDDQSVIEKRLSMAHDEIMLCDTFDYLVVNDKFDVALVDLRSIVRSHRLSMDAQLGKHRELLAELTKTR